MGRFAKKQQINLLFPHSLIKFSLKKIGIISFVIGICLIFSVGCDKPPEPPIAGIVNNWFKLQKDIAQKLNKEWGGEKFYIAPTKGAVYPIGTAFNVGSPSPISEFCQFNKETIHTAGMPPFPEFTSGSEFKIDLTIPTKWLEAIKIGEAKVGANKSYSMKFSISEMEQSFVYDTTFENTLKDEKCLNSLGNILERDKLIIRGYIPCKFSVSSIDKWGANANLKVIEKDGLEITFDRDSGSYHIEQTEPFEWFTIFVKISALKVYDKVENMEELVGMIKKNPSVVALSNNRVMSSRDLDALKAQEESQKSIPPIVNKISTVMINVKKPNDDDMKAFLE